MKRVTLIVTAEVDDASEVDVADVLWRYINIGEDYALDSCLDPELSEEAREVASAAAGVNFESVETVENMGSGG